MNARKLISVSAILLIYYLLITDTSQAVWVSRGPAGTSARSLYCSQENPDVVFVGTNGGVYKTDDSGETWVYKGLRFRDIDAIGARIACGPYIYAGGWDELFWSPDGGDNWSVRAALPDDISALNITYSPNCVGYVGTDDGVFVSNGNSGLIGTDISVLAVDSGNTVYAATEEEGIFKSSDSGLTWNPVNNGLSFLNINALKIDSDDYLYAGSTGGGVFFSNNYGESWTSRNNGLPDVSGLYLVFALEKDSNGNLYAGVLTSISPLTGAVYKSTNKGDNWITTDGAINGFHAETMCVTSDGTLYVGTTHGIFSTGDFGASWLNMTNNISAVEFSNTFVENSVGTTFIASDGSGIYKTTNGGDSWIAVGVGNPADANDLLMDEDGNIFATAGDVFGVVKSINDGGTWSPASNGLPTYSFYGLNVYEEGNCLGMDENKNIYIGLENGAVYKTDNHAETWTPTSPLPFSDSPQEIIALIGATGETIYAATDEGDGIFKSINGGTIWEKKNNGLPEFPDVIEMSFFRDNITGDIYVGLWNGGLYRTSNGGDNWTRVAIPASDCDVRSVTMDQYGNLYAVVCSGAVYYSRNKGTSWIDVSSGLKPWDNVEGINVTGIFADKLNHIMLATQSDGMYLLSRVVADVNMDEKMDISDVILMLRIALKLDPSVACSDLNADGPVDISDVILTLRVALGLDELKQCK